MYVALVQIMLSVKIQANYLAIGVKILISILHSSYQVLYSPVYWTCSLLLVAMYLIQS